MDHWFSVIASGCELAANTVKELDDVGFVVIRTSRGGLFKVPTSAVTTNKGRTKRLGCVPKRLRVLELLPSTS